MTVHFVVKFWLYDYDGVTIHNLWVASTAADNKDETVMHGHAVAKAMQTISRNGLPIERIKFVGFEDMSTLKGNGLT